ncbi:TPA: gp53-like domain-containing protein [Escherichia coli]
MMPVSRYLCIFINVGLGTASKLNVGTGANQIPDINSFASSTTTNGYQKLPSGLIIQWGSININVQTAGTTVSQVVTLPITFPTTTLWNGGTNVNTTTPNAAWASTTAGGRTSITVYLYKASVGSNYVNWMVLGY